MLNNSLLSHISIRLGLRAKMKVPKALPLFYHRAEIKTQNTILHLTIGYLLFFKMTYTTEVMSGSGLTLDWGLLMGGGVKGPAPRARAPPQWAKIFKKVKKFRYLPWSSRELQKIIAIK